MAVRQPMPLIQQILAELTAINGRLDRLDAIEGRLDTIEGRLDTIEGRLDAIENSLTDLKVRQENGRIKVTNGKRYALDKNAALQPLLSPQTGLPIQDCPGTALAISELTTGQANRILQALGAASPAGVKERRMSVQWEFLNQPAAGAKAWRLGRKHGGWKLGGLGVRAAAVVLVLCAARLWERHCVTGQARLSQQLRHVDQPGQGD